MLKGHGGNIYALAQKLGCPVKKIIDMSSNLNPLGPPAGLIDYLAKQIDVITCLPEVDSSRIISLFAQKYKIDPSTVLAAGGTTQLIYALPGILKAKNVLILGPTYADYEDACIISKTPYSYFMSKAKNDFEPDINELEKLLPDFDTIFICNPNNPTGKLILADRLKKLCTAFPQTRFIIDESYLPFINQYERHSMLGADLPNLLILNSMSKIFKIPGLRIGFLIAPAGIISEFRRHLLPWSVNSLAQTAISYLLEQGAFIDDYIIETQKFIKKEKIIFLKHLENYPELTPCSGLTPFILIKLGQTLKAEKICGILGEKKILIRNCANFKGLSNQFIRIALKNQEENTLLAQALKSLGKDD